MSRSICQLFLCLLTTSVFSSADSWRTFQEAVLHFPSPLPYFSSVTSTIVNMPCFLQHLTGFIFEKQQLWYDTRMKCVSKDRKSLGQFVLLYLVYALHCVYACVCIVSVCLVRCSRGRTTAPTPVGEAQTQSRGRQHHPSSQALSSGIRLSPKRRRPKSPARRLPSSPPAPRGRSVAQTFTLCFSLCPTGSV